MKTGYIRFNGADETKVDRETKRLREAGCVEIIVDEYHKYLDVPKLEAYLTEVKEGDELIVCSSGSLSRKIDVLMRAVKTLKDANAKLTILDGGIDPDNQEKQLAMNYLQAHAELAEQGL